MGMQIKPTHLCKLTQSTEYKSRCIETELQYQFQAGSTGTQDELYTYGISKEIIRTEFCPHLNDLNRLASLSSLPCVIWLRIDTAEISTFSSGLSAELQLWEESRGQWCLAASQGAPTTLTGVVCVQRQALGPVSK